MSIIKRISFDLEEFKTWLVDLINTEYDSCGKWDIITDGYELDEDGNLHYWYQWSDHKDTIKERQEIALVGKIE